MKQTTKYQLNLIESGDRFLPDPINENTQALEDALISHNEDSTAHSKLQTATNAHVNDKSNPHGVTAAQTGAAPSSHNHSAGNITSGILPVARGGTGSPSVDSAPTSGSTKMVTSGGIYNALTAKFDESNLPWITGTYTGDGEIGVWRAIDIGFCPTAVIIVCTNDCSTPRFGAAIRHGSANGSSSTVQGGTYSSIIFGSNTINITSTGFTVYKEYSAYDRSMNDSNTTYLYLAFK